MSRRLERAARVAPRSVLLVVAGLTCLAFALRVSEVGQSLFGDELILFRAVHNRGFGGVLNVVHDTESTPPLHFVLAWATARIGDPTIGIRLPSLVLGTATVPLIYLLGARTVGRAAGLVGAALAAIDPYAIFYGTEGRAYATLAFVVTLSTLSLLAATRSGRLRWWIAFAVSSSAALYTHYVALFVIAAQIGWALWAFPARRRAVLLSTVAIVVLYLPWVPSFFVQRRDSAEQRYTDAHSLGDALSRLLKVLAGHPFVPLRDLPGQAWMVLFVGALAGAAALALLRLVRGRGGWKRPSRETTLIVLLAAATPVGVILYSLGPTSIFAPRSMIPSFPAACLAIGALLVRPWPPWRAVAVASTPLAVGVGGAKTLDHDYQRPPLRQVARFVDDEGARGDPVLASTDPLNFDALKTHLKGQHPIFGPILSEPVQRSAWKHASKGGSVFLVRDQVGIGVGMPPLAGPDNRFVLRDVRRYSAFLLPVAVGRYAGEVRGSLRTGNGRPVISWSLGRNIVVVEEAARGFVEGLSAEGRRLILRGWATDAARRGSAEWVLAFSTGRLIAAGAPNGIRADLAKAYGRDVLLAGFRLTARTRRASRLTPSEVRVFAVVGDRASELEYYRGAKTAARERPHS